MRNAVRQVGRGVPVFVGRGFSRDARSAALNAHLCAVFLAACASAVAAFGPACHSARPE